MQIRHAQPDPPLLAAQQRREDKSLDYPLVPHLAVVGPAPHADFQLGVVGEVERCLYAAPEPGQPLRREGGNRSASLEVKEARVGFGGGDRRKREKAYLQRKKDRKPRDHIGALPAHGDGIRAQLDAAVEVRLEVAGQAVADAALAAAEGEAGVARVVRVAAGRGEGGGQRVGECPGGVDGGGRREGGRGCGGGGGGCGCVGGDGSGGGGGEVVDGVQHDDPGRFGRRGVGESAGGDVGVEFGGGDRGQVGGVGGWDGDAVGRVEDVLDAVEAFGRELVVTE